MISFHGNVKRVLVPYAKARAGWQPPWFETKHVGLEEMIKYSQFERKVMCTVPGHGGHHIEHFEEKPRFRCRLCENMEAREPGWKSKQKAKVVERKMRQVFHIPFVEYIGEEGPFVKAMSNMLPRKQDVILLGKKMCTEPRHKYVRLRNGKAMMMTRDFMERQGLAAKVNNQMQFEYYNQTTSLESEGITVYLLHPGRKAYETVFFLCYQQKMLKTEGWCTGTLNWYWNK